MMVIWTVLPSQQGEVIKAQNRVPLYWTYRQCHSAANGWPVRHLPRVEHLSPLIQQDNVTYHLTFKSGIGWPPHTSQLVAVLELGLNGISRVSTYHGPHIGWQFLLWVLPSTSLGGDFSTGPMALWIDNSEMAAVVEVVFIYNEHIWRELHRWAAARGRIQTRRVKGKDSTINKKILNIYINNESRIGHASLLQGTASITKKETSQIIFGTTLDGLLRTKLKYIQLRKIKVQNGNKLTCGSLRVITSAALELKSWKPLAHIICDGTRRFSLL